MKTFEQLTSEQQQNAIQFAKKIMEDSLRTGILQSESILTTEEVDRLAKEAAENGIYDKDGLPHVEGMDVPYHFLGGCV